MAFVYGYCFREVQYVFWQAYLWAIPASSILLLYFNRVWHKNILASIILKSILLWSLLLCIYLQFFFFLLWMIFIIGVPIEAIFILSGNLTKFK